MQSARHPGSRRARWTPALLLLLGAAAGLIAWQLTPHAVRGTSPDGFTAAPDWTPLTTAEAALHSDASTSACERQLQEIGQALARYQRDYHRLPDQLSDLFPRYLPDRGVYHCPADPTPGAPGRPDLHHDPRLACSYSYEASADPCRGVPLPLGPQLPASDIPDLGNPGSVNGGSCRHATEYQQTFFGGWVPVVRCLHHPGADDEEWVLNLSLDGHVYSSAADPGSAGSAPGLLGWQYRPEVIEALLTRFERDLAAGPSKLQRRWDLAQLSLYVESWEQHDLGARLRAARPRLRSVAERLLAVAPKLPDARGLGQPTVLQSTGWHSEEPASMRRPAAEMAVRLLVLAGEYQRAFAALQEARRLPVGPLAGIDPAWVRIDLARGLGDREKEISLLQESVRPPASGFFLVPSGPAPVNRPAMARLAAAEEAVGRSKQAARYRLLAEPTHKLIGQPAPELTLPDGRGRPVSLRSARRGKRAVLLAFWSDEDPGCQGEFPYLQELYTQLQGKGFELISILHLPSGSTPAPLRFPLADTPAWPIALQAEYDEVVSDYSVEQYPTLFLLDAGGRVVWCAAGFHRSDLTALRRALGRLGLV